MNENETKLKIIDYIASGNSLYQICENVFTLLANQCTPTILEFFFNEIDSYIYNENPSTTDDEKEIIENQIDKYGKAWNEIIGTLLNERLDCEKFYSKLWESIVGTPLFEAKETKVCIFYLACINMCIPYHLLQSDIQIDEEQYMQYIEELKNDIANIRSLVFQPCRHYTDRASALLKLLEQYNEPEKKIILMVQIIKFFELKTKHRLKKQMQD